MVTFFDPDGDIQTNWLLGDYPPNTHYTAINDEVREPNSAAGGNWIYANDTAENVVDEFTFENITVTGEITEIVIWVFGIGGVSREVDWDLYNGSSWEGYQTFNDDPAVFDDWYAMTFSGLSMDQTDMNNVKVRCRSYDNYDWIGASTVRAMYLRISNNPVGGGPAGISKVYGIATADVGKKYGVSWSDIKEIYGIT